jgi:hypothetical protein
MLSFDVAYMLCVVSREGPLMFGCCNHYFSMLQMLSLDVTDMCCWVLQTLFLNVADVVFRCRRHVVLGVVLRRREKRAPDVKCCTQHGSQHGRNIVATWSQHEGGPEERRKTPDVGCCKQPRSQYFHNTLAIFTR